MANNIYLELELFLDPAITDVGALTAEINKKISNWNKMLNADPKNKVRVSKAKEHLAQGLSNLQGQADEARNEKLLALRNDIKKAGRVGGINETKLKKLKSTHRTFFSEATIENESGGAMASSAVPQLPKFTPPKCPNSLVCTKRISFKEMEKLAEDLELIDGKPKNLYELLKGSPTDTIERLTTLAKDLASKVVKMPKTNLQADPLNRLSGKCLNFFKDEQNKKNYDIALKRFPFDDLCDGELHWNIDKESGIPWEIYQESIRKTAQLGFIQGESEWLVYEYYCEINKCPDPIPEAERPVQTVMRPGTEWVGTVTKNAGQILWHVSEQSKKWFSTMRQKMPATSSKPIRIKQPDVPKSDKLQKTLDGIRKKFSQQKNPTTLYLNGLFEELDTMVVQHQTAPEEMLRNLKTLRAEVAEKLGDLMYAENHFVVAMRCYQAVLDSMPQHTKATSRFRAINGSKSALYQQIQSALTAKDYLACRQSIEELKTKFAADPETEDFIRNVEKQIAGIAVSKEYVQQLISENRWYTLANILEGTDQPSYREVLQKAKKRVTSATDNFPVIRKTLQKGRIEKVRQQLMQIRNFIAGNRSRHFSIVT